MIGRDWRKAVQLAAVCSFVFVPMSRPLRASNSASSEQIDAILATAGLKSTAIPGAAITVFEGNQTVFERGYGVTDLKTLHKIDAHTNFRLASCTKQFTAMAIMLLVHDGKLRYDERLTEIFPDFPEYGRSITVRNLLNHTSGLLDYEDLMPPLNPNVPVEQQQIQDAGVLALLERQNATKFPPGTKWEYSNSGYVVLGLIVQKVSGQSFPDFLRHRIFAPLDMSHTIAYVQGKNEVSNRAFGHTFENAGWKQTDQSPTSATLGDGGVYSSLDDLKNWDRALRDRTLLSQSEMQEELTPVNAPGVVGPDNTPAQYGFGWFLNAHNGHRRMWHYGETVGFRTTVQRFTDDNLTIILLSNRADVNPSEVALKIADLYLGATAKP